MRVTREVVMSYRLSGEVLVRRTPDEVFDVVADERNEPAYNPAMRSVEKLTSGPVGVGSRFEAVMGRGRGRYPMRTEITGFDRPHRVTSRTTMAGMEVEGSLTSSRP